MKELHNLSLKKIRLMNKDELINIVIDLKMDVIDLKERLRQIHIISFRNMNLIGVQRK